VGLGTGVGVGDGTGVGEGLGDGLGEGDADGDGDAPGDGEAEGEVPGATRTWTVAVACDDPDRATRLKLVVQPGLTCRVPLAVTVPMPLSISTVSAASTSQLSVVAAPSVMSPGVATNFWMDSVLGWVKSLTIPQLRAARAGTIARRK
jgi:hypothetical protein